MLLYQLISVFWVGVAFCNCLPFFLQKRSFDEEGELHLSVDIKSVFQMELEILLYQVLPSLHGHSNNEYRLYRLDYTD